MKDLRKMLEESGVDVDSLQKPIIRLSVKDETLNENPSVKKYLEYVEKEMNKVYLKHLEDLCIYGTSIIKTGISEGKVKFSNITGEVYGRSKN